MKKMNNFMYTCLLLDIEDSTNFLISTIYNVYQCCNNDKKLEGLNFSRISSFWKRLVFFVHVYFRFCFATTAVTLHWANKRVHYSKGLGVLAEVLAISCSIIYE